jgi:hypothetical protein
LGISHLELPVKVNDDLLTCKSIYLFDWFYAFFKLFIDMSLMENHPIINRVTVHTPRAT